MITISKKRLLAIAFAIIAAIAFWWIYSRAYVQVSIENPGDASIEYRLTNQSNDDEIVIDSSEHSVKKLVPRGSYELLVTQGDKNYFSTVTIKGFFTTTDVTAKLEKERSRTFTGNSPGYCMYYDQNASNLYSHNCSGSYTDMKFHTPASASSPTYALSPATPDRPLRSIITVKGVPYTLLGDSTNWPPNMLVPLRSNFDITGGTLLSGLPGDKSYFAKEYKEGFIVYSESYDVVRYYTSPDSKPEKITIQAPTNDALTGVFLDVRDETIAALFTNNEVGDESLQDVNEEQEAKGEEGSTVTLYTPSNTRQLHFNKTYSRALVCGDAKLCMLSNRTLEIYNIKDGKNEKIFNLDKVENIIVAGKSLIIVRGDDVLMLDPDTLQGYQQYSFGDYIAYCGIQAVGNNYILCMVDDSSRTSALYINQAEEDTDSIDKKIQELYKVPDVDNISVYGSFIYTSPITGSSEYRPESDTYGYNPAIINESKDQISKAIDRLGIDRNKYQIISTY